MSLYVLQGLRPWLLQRISAVYLVLFILYIAVNSISISEPSYEAWLAWLFSPFNTIAVGLFFLALLLHAWIGIRDVILDYVHNTFVRLVALTLVITLLMGSGIWTARILLLSLTI